MKITEQLESAGLVLVPKAEIERLSELKTPVSRELLNLTKTCLEDAEAEVERLRAELTVRLDYIRQIDADNRELRLATIKLAEGK